MREILFRGKRIDDGEWVEGYLICDEFCNTSIPYIGYLCGDGVDVTEVAPETVGQYTGLKDKNGKRIFEGDIVHVHDRLLGYGSPYREFDGVIGFRDASFVVITDTVAHYRWLDYDVTFIGKIHDNPELLEVNRDKR